MKSEPWLESEEAESDPKAPRGHVALQGVCEEGMVDVIFYWRELGSVTRATG